jgi:integrase
MKQRTGYVYQENGRWYARLTYTDEYNQRRNIRRRTQNKTAAKEILKQITRELDEQGARSIDGSRMTMSDLCDFYGKHYLKPAEYINGRKVAGLRSVKTVANYLSVFQKHFGKRRVRSLTHSDLQTFRTVRLKTPTCQGRPRTIATVNREMSYLRRLLSIAERESWIARNPFKAGDSLINISDEEKRERILTFEEEARLLKACVGRRAHLRAIIMCALDTGMRRGEILKLCWRDIDWEDHVIQIQAFNTKTMRERQVAVTRRLYAELKHLWEASDKDDTALVFGITDTFKTAFNGACRASGLDGVRFHDLRHTAATRLVGGHLSLYEVGRILGHTQPTTTYRYVNANHETIRRAAAVIDALNSANSAYRNECVAA